MTVLSYYSPSYVNSYLVCLPYAVISWALFSSCLKQAGSGSADLRPYACTVLFAQAGVGNVTLIGQVVSWVSIKVALCKDALEIQNSAQLHATNEA